MPVAYPESLPPGACIYSCEQNPWETAHVLSSGDVVACEVLDKIPLGNLLEQSIDEIWHGSRIGDFASATGAARLRSAALAPGRKPIGPVRCRATSLRCADPARNCCMDGTILRMKATSGAASNPCWCSRRGPDRGPSTSPGALPPGPEQDPNLLTIRLNGALIGTVTNPWAEIMPFGLDFPVAGEQAEPWILEFRIRHVYRAMERGTGADQRDLGFALALVTSKEFVPLEHARGREQELQPLVRAVEAVDRWAVKLGRLRRRQPAPDRAKTPRPGLSILIPERDNRQELAACLGSVRKRLVSGPSRSKPS